MVPGMDCCKRGCRLGKTLVEVGYGGGERPGGFGMPWPGRVASRSSKAIPPFSSTAAFTADKVAANVAAVDENGRIALDDLEATFGMNATSILRSIRLFHGIPAIESFLRLPNLLMTTDWVDKLLRISTWNRHLRRFYGVDWTMADIRLMDWGSGRPGVAEHGAGAGVEAASQHQHHHHHQRPVNYNDVAAAAGFVQYATRSTNAEQNLWENQQGFFGFPPNRFGHPRVSMSIPGSVGPRPAAALGIRGPQNGLQGLQPNFPSFAYVTNQESAAHAMRASYYQSTAPIRNQNLSSQPIPMPNETHHQHQPQPGTHPCQPTSSSHHPGPANTHPFRFFPTESVGHGARPGPEHSAQQFCNPNPRRDPGVGSAAGENVPMMHQVPFQISPSAAAASSGRHESRVFEPVVADTVPDFQSHGALGLRQQATGVPVSQAESGMNSLSNTSTFLTCGGSVLSHSAKPAHQQQPQALGNRQMQPTSLPASMTGVGSAPRDLRIPEISAQDPQSAPNARSVSSGLIASPIRTSTHWTSEQENLQALFSGNGDTATSSSSTHDQGSGNPSEEPSPASSATSSQQQQRALCKVCSKPSTCACESCLEVAYCSETCQQSAANARSVSSGLIASPIRTSTHWTSEQENLQALFSGNGDTATSSSSSTHNQGSGNPSEEPSPASATSSQQQQRALCKVCSKPSTCACESCLEVAYCSETCQRRDGVVGKRGTKRKCIHPLSKPQSHGEKAAKTDNPPPPAAAADDSTENDVELLKVVFNNVENLRFETNLVGLVSPKPEVDDENHPKVQQKAATEARRSGGRPRGKKAQQKPVSSRPKKQIRRSTGAEALKEFQEEQEAALLQRLIIDSESRRRMTFHTAALQEHREPLPLATKAKGKRKAPSSRGRMKRGKPRKGSDPLFTEQDTPSDPLLVCSPADVDDQSFMKSYDFVNLGWRTQWHIPELNFPVAGR
ncbi:unnamed protein product [Notodromas monacha]|uniref:MYND-type domain-containing protein n=1 Tax=Notodromas monacha TaxID=399045 RepID=A0A7R9BPF1_9CRUS|nr:unnamed protein product [Notodromas monacha]CAG0919245.1 unnamed protein product [Notodromas monacha]